MAAGSLGELELAPRLTDPQAERLWRRIGAERASGASLVFDAPDKAVAYLASPPRKGSSRRTSTKGGRGARRAR